ncbi:MAG: DegV family protein [Chloroflexi bacterium]|nr:DegV family protein [Chloroflexota bacterium]
MPKIAVITDTDSSLPAALAAQHAIELVPIKIQFGDESYDTGTEIDDRQVFARVDSERKLPTTAAPAPGRFIQAYQRAFDSGADEIICITISSEVSAVCTAAMTAVEEFPGRAIHVVDSHTLGMAQGFMVLTAAELAAGGATADEILQAVAAVRERSHLFGALASLKYLAMSGRVGHLAAGVASVLNIRPILSVRDGKLQLLEKIRTQRLAWERLITLTEQAADGKALERVAFMHVAAPEACALFAEQFNQRVACPQDILTVELTPGLSVHTGAGMVGVAVITAR